MAMHSSARFSIVMPVRNSEKRIVNRVERLLESLADLTFQLIELVIVDDGSQDATVDVLSELKSRFSQIRIVRHGRPRGFEAAGQTGLERAAGELVFVQESDAPLRIDDLLVLLQLSQDASVVAARAESRTRVTSPELIRRLRAWGTNADRQFEPRASVATLAPQSAGVAGPSSLQMIRRPHLQRLAGPQGSYIRLESHTLHANSRSATE